MTEPVDSPPLTLITRERNSKLELLIHLLTNLTQPLVLCGPDGIGKTTVLNALQNYKEGVWQYCIIQGHASLSYEDILNQLARAFQLGKESSAAELTRVFSQYQTQNRKIVLLIDDAGSLVPGLITSLIQYCEANPALRIVFTLTHDDMYVVSRSDHVIDNCHFIELPPLTESQCGEFLQTLAISPKTGITLAAISDTMVAQIYRDSRGIPGKVIAELPVLSQGNQPSSLKGLINLAILVALVVLGVQGLRSERFSIDKLFLSLRPLQKLDTVTLQEHPTAPLDPFKDNQAEPKTATVTSDNQEAEQITAQTGETEPANTVPDINPEDILVNRDTEEEDDVTDSTETSSNISTENQATPNLEGPVEASKVEPTSPPKTASPETAGDQLTWLTEQPSGDYTLQLMVLYKLEPVLQLQQRYQDIGQQIKYVKRVKFGKERFIVFYGTFASKDLAKAQIAALPKELKQAMPRQIGAILAELK
jgi:DamX protein